MTDQTGEAGVTGPQVVAEISGNHKGSLETALEIVRMVARAGAHLVKLQTFRPDTITLPMNSHAFMVREDHALWGSRSLWDLYEEAHTPYSWHEPIFDLSRQLGLIPFSTPFDEEAVGFLEGLGTPMYKIASLEIVDLPLIRTAASTGKPLVISTGASTIAEVDAAVDAARGAGCVDLTLLLCTSSYPAPPEDANLSRLPVVRDLFDVKVGLSDHTQGTAVAITAVALGATLIEKHVTLSRASGSVDSAFSLEEAELKALVTDVAAAHSAIGSSATWRTPAESDAVSLRPSLYITADVRSGDALTPLNVRSLRPSGGLPPDSINAVEGRRFSQDATAGTPLTWDLLD